MESSFKYKRPNFGLYEPGDNKYKYTIDIPSINPEEYKSYDDYRMELDKKRQ